MKKIVAIFLLFGLFFSFLACKTKKRSTNYSLEKFEIDSIVYGGGGGVTGMSEKFILNGKDGSWKKMKSKYGSDIPPKRIDEDKLSKIFIAINQSYWLGKKIDEPGNISFFIEIYQKGGSPTLWKWGSPSYKINPEISKIYIDLQQLQNP